jgi:hypothetical protein
MELLFPFSQYWWSYAVFTGVVLLLLVIDLGVFHRRAHVVSFRESLAWSVVWVALALLFNLAALAVILIFVGLKMVWLNDAFGGKFPIEWSLAIIGSLLGGAVVVSWLLPGRHSLPHPR